MAGIYIHIPFCRRACHYCDFHFTTNLTNVDGIVDALTKEIAIRNDYLGHEQIDTVYFGGGTPSLLSANYLDRIMNAVHANHSVDHGAEITLEANPEDLTSEKIRELRLAGVNRLSLGTQSFIDKELKWMNRMHSSAEALSRISEAQNAGSDNISIDLIFGLPQQTDQDWMHNLETAMSLGIQHVSSYALTVEERTVLNRRIQHGQEARPDEDSVTKFLEMNMKFLPDHGFEQYEISNFAASEHISKHNSAYWQGKSYIGIGPSAHSYNHNSRQWNVRSNAAYLSGIEHGKLVFDKETLSVKDKLNEHILTGLRTKWGMRKSILESIEKGSWQKVFGRFQALDPACFQIGKDVILLSDRGKLMADKLTADLFF